MNANGDIAIFISPEKGKITVEETTEGVKTRKEINRESLLKCFQNSIRIENPAQRSGFLPLNTLAVVQSSGEKRLVLWHPKLYADVSVYDTPYPHFPIPRLVFGFSVNSEGRVLGSRIGVVADETPTPETVMYHYPFSNVTDSSGHLCVGANVMPTYRKLYKAANLPAFLLSIPNNMHSYHSTHNKLGLEYRALMEHLKDKEPGYYYSHILISNGKTLGDFIDNM